QNWLTAALLLKAVRRLKMTTGMRTGSHYKQGFTGPPAKRTRKNSDIGIQLQSNRRQNGGNYGFIRRRQCLSLAHAVDTSMVSRAKQRLAPSGVLFFCPRFHRSLSRFRPTASAAARPRNTRHLLKGG